MPGVSYSKGFSHVKVISTKVCFGGAIAYNKAVEREVSIILLNTLKPIFHCDAKHLASGVGVGQCP